MTLVIDVNGEIRCLYEEMIDLAALGCTTITRASQVDPDEAGRWWSDMAPSGGPRLGPFDKRSLALRAERQWLEQDLLSRPCPAALARQLTVTEGEAGE